MVEAKVDWIDGERFVAQASSGHAFVVDSDRTRNTAPGPMELVLLGLVRLHGHGRGQHSAKKRRARGEGASSRRRGAGNRTAHGLHLHQTDLYGYRRRLTQGSGRCRASFGREVLRSFCHAAQNSKDEYGSAY